MKISYFGHSCFEFSAEKTIITDPFDGIGYDLGIHPCDYCTVSHSHSDHNAVSHVRAKRVLYNPEGEFGGFSCFHDEFSGKRRGEVTCFCFTVGGFRVLHMGDVGERLGDEMKRKLDALGGVDVLCLPIGGNYTIDYKTALEYADYVKPSVLIPMHYHMAGGTLDIDGAEKFLKSCKNMVTAHGEFLLEKPIKACFTLYFDSRAKA